MASSSPNECGQQTTDGQCMGPTEAALAIRRSYNDLSTKHRCAIDQQHCEVDGKADCYQCCPKNNGFGRPNHQCPLSHVCQGGICILANESASFEKPCTGHYQCGQLQCIDGVCQQCSHGEPSGEYVCMAGQYVQGLGAALLCDTLVAQAAFWLVLTATIAVLYAAVFCCISRRRK